MRNFFKHINPVLAVLYGSVVLMLSVVHHHNAEFLNDESSSTIQLANNFCQVCYTFQSQDVTEPQIIAATLPFECFITEVSSLSSPIQPLTHFSNRAPPHLT